MDYLKDKMVTCDEFAAVWKGLDEATRKVRQCFHGVLLTLTLAMAPHMYKECELEAKKAAKGGWIFHMCIHLSYHLFILPDDFDSNLDGSSTHTCISTYVLLEDSVTVDRGLATDDHQIESNGPFCSVFRSKLIVMFRVFSIRYFKLVFYWHSIPINLLQQD